MKNRAIDYAVLILVAGVLLTGCGGGGGGGGSAATTTTTTTTTTAAVTGVSTPAKVSVVTTK